jgi:hypothetical protein
MARGSGDKHRSRRWLGMRREVAPSGSGFYANPRWTRFSKRELDGPGGEPIEVGKSYAPKLEAILNDRDYFAALPTPTLPRYEVVTDDRADWPGLILRVSPLQTSVAARVSTTELAHSLTDLLNRLEEEDARRPKGANYWNRGI